MPTLDGASVKVAGLRELRAALRRLDDRSLLKELGSANARIADLVVSKARGNASSAMEQSAAGRLKASKAVASARVILGGKPYDMGAEFGAGRNQRRSRSTGSYLGFNQFKPWRGSGGGAGYFLFPAIRDSRDELIEAYAKGIERVWQSNG